MKFIIVSGPQNTGKTTAITEFREQVQNLEIHHAIIYHGENVEDFRATGKIEKNGVTYNIAIASAGDDRTIINQNFNFFQGLEPKPDIILISVRKTKRAVVPLQVTMERIHQYLALIGQQVDDIETVITTIETSHAAPAKYDEARDRVVKAIYDAI